MKKFNYNKFNKIIESAKRIDEKLMNDFPGVRVEFTFDTHRKNHMWEQHSCNLFRLYEPTRNKNVYIDHSSTKTITTWEKVLGVFKHILKHKTTLESFNLNDWIKYNDNYEDDKND